MIRFLLWLLGGVLLGGIIHIVVILTLPLLAEETVWTRLDAFGAQNRMVILPPVASGEPNPLGLDPDLVYGLCQVDLANGPGYLSGRLPDAFWSVALFRPSGVISYSATNRDGIGQTVELAVFNAGQTRLLARQEIDIAEGTLVVEAPENEIAVIFRLSPPHDAMRARYAEELSAITCETRRPEAEGTATPSPAPILSTPTTP